MSLLEKPLDAYPGLPGELGVDGETALERITVTLPSRDCPLIAPEGDENAVMGLLPRPLLELYLDSRRVTITRSIGVHCIEDEFRVLGPSHPSSNAECDMERNSVALVEFNLLVRHLGFPFSPSRRALPAPMAQQRYYSTVQYLCQSSRRKFFREKKGILVNRIINKGTGEKHFAKSYDSGRSGRGL